MKIGTSYRGVEPKWDVVVRLGPVLNGCTSHLVQTYLLAGLLLAMSLPVPDSLRAACRCRGRVRGALLAKTVLPGMGQARRCLRCRFVPV
jgi:hypothetical protein